MASLFTKPNSPYWQLRYRDEAGIWRKKSLKFRKGIGTETAAARREEARHTLEERSATRQGDKALWKRWVPGWIETHFTNPFSRTRAVNAWTRLEEWFLSRGFITPAFIRYEHAAEFFAARKKAKAAHNTALLEVKFGSQILQEAVRRELIPGNPWVKLGIKRARGKVKPEITSEQAAIVQAGLIEHKMPDWMSESWLVYTTQGCRATESKIPMADIDEKAGVIWFEKQKGDKPFATKIHPALLPLIKKKRKAGAEFLIDLPPNSAKKWWVFLREKLKLPFSIHSTRVTVATQMARGGVDRTEAMRYLNHSSELVHRIYQRLRPDDLSAAVAAVGFQPSSSQSNNGKPETQGAPRARRARGKALSGADSASDTPPLSSPKRSPGRGRQGRRRDPSC